MLFSSLLAFSAAAATLVVAQSTANLDPAGAGLKITIPSAQDWWVVSQTNLLAWTCHTTTLPSYAVYVSNPNVTLLTATSAILSPLDNTVCSKTIDATRFNPGPGYQILLTNPVNLTDVYAVSEPFELKAAGSAFPVITTTDFGSTSTSTGASGTSTSGGASPSNTAKSAASRSGVSVGLMSVVGLAITSFA